MSGSIAPVTRDPDEICVPTSLRRPPNDGQTAAGEADRKSFPLQAKATEGTEPGTAIVAIGDDLSADAAGSKISGNCRTDDHAGCGAVPQDRNTRGADLGPGAKRRTVPEPDYVHRAFQ